MRTPQLILTIKPDGDIMAEIPGANGARHSVTLGTDEETIGRGVLRMLRHQVIDHARTLGLESDPTDAQVRHWQMHSDRGARDPMCAFCIADELGIDTSPGALAKARHQADLQRRMEARKTANLHRVGDGTVKVRYLKSRSRHINQRPSAASAANAHVSMDGLFDDDDSPF